jgi:hypothetical protein
LQHVLKKLEDGLAGSQFTFLVQGDRPGRAIDPLRERSGQEAVRQASQV